MDTKSKVKTVGYNTFIGVLNNVVLVALNLISRKMFLRYIGIEYLSVGQVINNILSVLAFSELGVSNAVLYMLYKPVAENDNEKITRIIAYYRKINKLIGLVILIAGMISSLFINRIINTSIPILNVYIIFAINLLYSASSYLCTYRQVLINAKEMNYIISKVSLRVNLIGIVIQCLIIYYTKNYYIYLLATITVASIINWMLYYKAGKLYPYLKEEKASNISSSEKTELITNVKSMFAVKFCSIVINNTDNILVSLFDLLMVGYCANYSIISTRIRGLISVFYNSVIYSLGVSNVNNSSEKKYYLFKCFLLINTFIASITALLLGVLWDDFIVLWLGNSYLIPAKVLNSLLLNYTWIMMITGIWVFRDTNGLFVFVKKVLVINAVVNLVLSILCGKIIGVAGVYFATIIADGVTSFWYDAKLVYKKVFDRTDYWKYLLFVIFNVFWVFISKEVINLIFDIQKITLKRFFYKGIFATIYYILFFALLYGRSKMARDIINKFFSKNKGE